MQDNVWSLSKSDMSVGLFEWHSVLVIANLKQACVLFCVFNPYKTNPNRHLLEQSQ